MSDYQPGCNGELPVGTSKASKDGSPIWVENGRLHWSADGGGSREATPAEVVMWIEIESLRRYKAAAASHEHDYPIVSAFHEKHALPSMMRPSCLVCGKTPEEWPPAIRHAELPNVVVCAPCRDAARRAGETTSKAVEKVPDDAFHQFRGALVRVVLEAEGCPPDCSHEFHRWAIRSVVKIAKDALARSPEAETSVAQDPERVEIARCPRCGALPRPTLLGRMICDRCGGLDVQQPPSRKVIEQAYAAAVAANPNACICRSAHGDGTEPTCPYSPEKASANVADSLTISKEAQ